MIISELELYEALESQIGKEKARTLVRYVEQKIEKEFEYKKEIFASKQDLATLEVRLSRTIYIVSVAQFLAIIASVLAIVKLMH